MDQVTTTMGVEAIIHSHPSSTFKFELLVPKLVSIPKGIPSELDRDRFYEWVWAQFAARGLLGIHEGTLLCDEAAEQGFEIDSWTVDSGEAPRERDWMSRQEQAQAELYFSDEKLASEAASILKNIRGLQVGSVEEQKQQDWDAEWKASFLNAGAGVEIAPFWRVVPPWVDRSQVPKENERYLKINPGAGFGTGTHETTQLCLEAIGKFSETMNFLNEPVLDFGSGSGILSVALALVGAQVDAIEIDPLAIDNATENAELNGMQSRIHFSQVIPNRNLQYTCIVANILKPVLLEFSDLLVNQLRPGGALILSGLIEKDVEPVVQKYTQLLGSSPLHIYEKGEWRALTFIFSPELQSYK